VKPLNIPSSSPADKDFCFSETNSQGLKIILILLKDRLPVLKSH